MTRVVNKYKESYDIYIGRGSKWGNPFSHLPNTQAIHRVANRQEAVDSFKEYILYGEGQHLLNDLEELKGKTLGCFCKPQSCHGDILAELVETLDI